MSFRVMREGALFLLAFLVIAAANLAGRESISLAGECYFLPSLLDLGEGQRREFESGEALRQSWRRINVPSCWQREFEDLQYFEGVAWYSRDFTYSGDPDLRHACLVFEGVNYTCRVSLNGTALVDHEGGYWGR